MQKVSKTKPFTCPVCQQNIARSEMLTTRLYVNGRATGMIADVHGRNGQVAHPGSNKGVGGWLVDEGDEWEWKVEKGLIAISKKVSGESNMQQVKSVRGSFPAWCQFFRSRENWVVLDTETTGLCGEVIDLAIVDHQGHALYNSLIKPTIPVEESALSVHKITNDMLTFAPSWADEWPKIAEILADKEIVVYNARFDMDRMLQSCEAHSIEMPLYTWHCLMLAYSDFYKSPGKYGSYKWQSLTSALVQQAQPIEGAHRVLGDALMAWKLLMHCGSGAELKTAQGVYVEKKA